jgi:hypothetical protein
MLKSGKRREKRAESKGQRGNRKEERGKRSKKREKWTSFFQFLFPLF